jgi:hypothetical protein
LLDDPTVPVNIPIARLVDPSLVEQMSEYALYGVLYFHRRFDVYERHQRQGVWRELALPHTALRRVGIMGLGEIGADCARKIVALKFPVNGWSRTAKHLAGVNCYHGAEGAFRRTDILVTVLPLTAATKASSTPTLSHMPRSTDQHRAGGLVVDPICCGRSTRATRGDARRDRDELCRASPCGGIEDARPRTSRASRTRHGGGAIARNIGVSLRRTVHILVDRVPGMRPSGCRRGWAQAGC